MKKIVCLDYDGTYTEFPELLDRLIGESQVQGYRVIMATMRYESENTKALDALKSRGVEIIFTGRKAKLAFLEALGIKPDLWIDDCPKWLFVDG